MFKAIAHQQGVSASEVKERIQSTICIYHKHDCRRTIAAISDALPDMDAAMRPLAEQTIHKLQNITDAAFEERKLGMVGHPSPHGRLMELDRLALPKLTPAQWVLHTAPE